MNQTWQTVLSRLRSGLYTLDDLRLASRYLRDTNQPAACRRIRVAAKRMGLAAKLKEGRLIRVQIVATSDDEKDEFRKFAWGDFWLQYEMTCHLGQRNVVVTRDNPDVIIQLFGFPRPLPQTTYNIVWCTSHPELLTPPILFQFDHIYTLGEPHAEVLRRQGFEAETLYSGSSKKPSPARQRQYPAIFVGNTKPRQGIRPCVGMLMETGYPFLVWGWGWEEHLPPERIAGHYIDYASISTLYAGSRFVLNDHHSAMTQLGMVSPKNFDVCSSGGFLLCERNPGISQVFGDSVPQFGNAAELKAILEEFDRNHEKREALRQQATQTSLKYTYDAAADTILNHLYNECLQPVDFHFDAIR